MSSCKNKWIRHNKFHQVHCSNWIQNNLKQANQFKRTKHSSFNNSKQLFSSIYKNRRLLLKTLIQPLKCMRELEVNLLHLQIK